MVMISTGIEEPKTPRMMSAKMSCGIESMMSTTRDNATSTHLPTTAAVKPSVMPMRKDNAVVAAAMPIVMRAP